MLSHQEEEEYSLYLTLDDFIKFAADIAMIIIGQSRLLNCLSSNKSWHILENLMHTQLQYATFVCDEYFEKRSSYYNDQVKINSVSLFALYGLNKYTNNKVLVCIY